MEFFIDPDKATSSSFNDYYCAPISSEERKENFLNSIPKIISEKDRDFFIQRLQDNSSSADFLANYPYGKTIFNPNSIRTFIDQYYNPKLRCTPKYKLVRHEKKDRGDPTGDWSMGQTNIYTYEDVRTGEQITQYEPKTGRAYDTQRVGGKRKYYKKISKKNKKSRKSQKKSRKSRNKTIKY